MCIYYLISFTKSIYFLLNFQIPFMFWIIILPLNILYYPTNESIRFSNNLIFLTVLRFIVISATFCQVFAGFSPAFGLGFGSCFGDFYCFSYFLPAFFRLLGWVWGAVLGISAVSATFSRLFPAFWLGFGSCFGDFCCFSYFLPVFFRLLGWVWGAVLGISAVPATFCRFFPGFLAEFGLFLLHLVGTKSELPLLAFWPAHLL